MEPCPSALPPAAPRRRVPFWRDLSVRGMMAIVAALALLCAAIAYQNRMIGRSHEFARRAHCLANLRQIGLSIAQYSRLTEGGQGPYPRGSIPLAGVDPTRWPGWASLTYPLGDEGCSGCAQISAGLPWDDPGQDSGGAQDDEMYCPSMSRAAPIRNIPAAYVGIAGLGVDSPALPTADPRAGIFGDNRVVRPADVRDGLAQTMMVVESSRPAGPWFAGGRNTVRGLDPAQQPYLGANRQFGGIHLGNGANALMADGSVRFVKDSVDPKVFETMSTIAGGEKVSVPGAN